MRFNHIISTLLVSCIGIVSTAPAQQIDPLASQRYLTVSSCNTSQTAKIASRAAPDGFHRTARTLEPIRLSRFAADGKLSEIKKFQKKLPTLEELKVSNLTVLAHFGSTPLVTENNTIIFPEPISIEISDEIPLCSVKGTLSMTYQGAVDTTAVQGSQDIPVLLFGVPTYKSMKRN